MNDLKIMLYHQPALSPLVDGFGFWCLMPLSAIFQLYRGDQF